MTTLGVLAVLVVWVIGAYLSIPFIEQCKPRRRDMIAVALLLMLVAVVIVVAVLFEARGASESSWMRLRVLSV